MKRALVFGQNVYLRPIEREDIDNGWLDWINDHAINRNLASRLPVTREGLEQYWTASQPPQAAMFAICLQEDDTYIGNARLSELDWVNRKCTSGQLIGEQRYRGRGFGSEALVLLFRYGFHELGMNRIYSAVIIDNQAALARNRKIGLKQEGIRRQDIFRNGRYFDSIGFAMLRCEFDEVHGGPDEWRARDAALAEKMDNPPR